jgi:XRE family transcriptional regulator, regulator of sulfur utilization
MLNRRDLLVAAITACATLGAVGFARSNTAIMRSTAVDWNAMEVKQTKYGMSRKVFQAPTPTLDELECHITTLNAGESPHAAHHHVDEEMILIKEGTVESTLNGVSRQVGPGSVIFQASDEMHGLRNIGSTPATYFVVKWKTPVRQSSSPPKQ